MFYKKIIISALLPLALFSPPKAAAQHSANDTILLGAFVQGADTFAMVFLPDVDIIGQYDPRFAKEREAYNRLRYNVFKVYPYALIAAEVLKNVDDSLDKMDRRHERKTYLKKMETELDSKFKGELKSLSIEQGQILVKLIDRQTGQNCFQIIRELKGGFNALLCQGVALIWSNNLKREYDPYDRDKDIEKIVQEIEAYNYHRYQYQLQQKQKAQLMHQVQQYQASHSVN